MKSNNSVILPPATLGILGGGQLGMMFTVAAKTMGYHVVVVDPTSNPPARLFADKHLCQAYDDPKVLYELEKCDAVTIEFENVDIGLLQKLEKKIRVSPSSQSVAIAQNRFFEKKHIRQAGLTTVPYQEITRENDCSDNCLGLLPGILKTNTLGYDGKGQIVVSNIHELRQAFLDLKGVACVLEKQLKVQSEVSIIVCRLDATTIQCFPASDNVHVDGILFTSTVPSVLTQKEQHQLRDNAVQLANYLDYVGVLGVEFFIVDDEQGIYVNEIAPRPHNSGHYTLNATLSSQFQQQVRILCGLPPLDTTLLQACVMVNILGDLWDGQNTEPKWRLLLQEPNIHLYLYNKTEARSGRKMGHFNVLGSESRFNLHKAINLLNNL